jgi:hypothetical protein
MKKSRNIISNHLNIKGLNRKKNSIIQKNPKLKIAIKKLKLKLK